MGALRRVQRCLSRCVREIMSMWEEVWVRSVYVNGTSGRDGSGTGEDA